MIKTNNWNDQFKKQKEKEKEKEKKYSEKEKWIIGKRNIYFKNKIKL